MTDFFDSAQHYQLNRRSDFRAACARRTKTEFTEWARSRLAALLEAGRSESAPRPSRQMTPASQKRTRLASSYQTVSTTGGREVDFRRKCEAAKELRRKRAFETLRQGVLLRRLRWRHRARSRTEQQTS